MRWLRANLAEIHAYGGLALASVGVGLWTLAGGLLLAGVGLFYLAHKMPPGALSGRGRAPGEDFYKGRKAA